MPKKCPDKQQNQEEPPVSLGRHMPQPAPVDDEAFARRAGEIIGNSNTSRHKASDAGGNKRFRSRRAFSPASSRSAKAMSLRE